MNRAKFFLAVRMDPLLFGGTLPESAVVTMNAMLDEWQKRKLQLLTWLAYMMSTARGEVGRNMAPVREGFAQSDAAARAYVKRNFPHYAMEILGHVWYGRGLVQLTWLRNYQAFRDEILRVFGVDIVANPDAVLRPDIAVYIMFEGMIRGIFTTKKLADYFTDKISDWINARRIINGTDKASLFGNMGQRFHAALLAAKEDAPAPSKDVEKNVTSRERGAAKVGTGGAAGTGAADAGNFDWQLWVIVGACVLVVVVALFLAYRKRKQLAEQWAKL